MNSICDGDSYRRAVYGVPTEKTWKIIVGQCLCGLIPEHVCFLVQDAGHLPMSLCFTDMYDIASDFFCPVSQDTRASPVIH